MARKRKIPTLQNNGRYYLVNVFKPDGKRTTVSFGPADGNLTVGEIYAAFGKWIDLYAKFPAKMLSYKNPYDAIEDVVNPSKITTIGKLIDLYYSWVEKSSDVPSGSNGTLIRTNRAKRFLKPYLDWSTVEFGSEELQKVLNRMEEGTFKSGKKVKKYTRTSINDTLKQIKFIWSWGVGREFVKQSQLINLDEVKPLKFGQAREKIKRAKVTRQEFDEFLKNISSLLGDLFELVWNTAMRPSEAAKMRPCDILTDDPECWLYIPGRDISPIGEHKTMRFGRIKAIPLTTKSQAKNIHLVPLELHV